MRRFLPLLLLLLGALPVRGQQQECAAGPAPAGYTIQEIQVGDEVRRYVLYIPPGYDGRQRLPLLLSFHGFTSNAAEQAAITAFDVIADREGVVLAFPQGLGRTPRWANGTSLFTPLDDPADVQFAAALVDTLTAELCIDSARVFATGFSAGGGMAHRLACEMADRITAIGTMSGAFASIPGGCQPVRPVPVIALHGTADFIVPIGGAGEVLPDTAEWAREWAQRNNCQSTVELTGEGYTRYEYGQCDEGVAVHYIVVEGLAHTWAGTPAPSGSARLAPGPQHISASETMWSFFTSLKPGTH
jgi:polyhydroxybutyrate depolymerase